MVQYVTAKRPSPEETEFLKSGYAIKGGFLDWGNVFPFSFLPLPLPRNHRTLSLTQHNLIHSTARTLATQLLCFCWSDSDLATRPATGDQTMFWLEGNNPGDWMPFDRQTGVMRADFPTYLTQAGKEKIVVVDEKGENEGDSVQGEESGERGHSGREEEESLSTVVVVDAFATPSPRAGSVGCLISNKDAEAHQAGSSHPQAFSFYPSTTDPLPSIVTGGYDPNTPPFHFYTSNKISPLDIDPDIVWQIENGVYKAFRLCSGEYDASVTPRLALQDKIPEVIKACEEYMKKMKAEMVGWEDITEEVARKVRPGLRGAAMDLAREARERREAGTGNNDPSTAAPSAIMPPPPRPPPKDPSSRSEKPSTSSTTTTTTSRKRKEPPVDTATDQQQQAASPASPSPSPSPSPPKKLKATITPNSSQQSRNDHLPTPRRRAAFTTPLSQYTQSLSPLPEAASSPVTAPQPALRPPPPPRPYHELSRLHSVLPDSAPVQAGGEGEGEGEAQGRGEEGWMAQQRGIVAGSYAGARMSGNNSEMLAGRAGEAGERRQQQQQRPVFYDRRRVFLPR
ncbi:MAG: hypothetical protein Q9202_000586 [Teloschistes flavicans]